VNQQPYTYMLSSDGSCVLSLCATEGFCAPVKLPLVTYHTAPPAGDAGKLSLTNCFLVFKLCPSVLMLCSSVFMMHTI